MTTTAPDPTTPVDDACAPAPHAQAMGPDAADRVAAVLKALADPLRLRMLSLITTRPTGEACVCDLAGVADVSQPTVSHHLKVLKDAGVLTSERRGTWVHYRVRPGVRRTVMTLLDSFAPTALDATPHGDARAGLTDVDPVLDRVIDRLAAEFPDTPRDAVQHLVRESYTSLARTATIGAHLVVNAERFARQRLADRSRPAADDGRPHVLFVCAANAGRSQLAAALLRRHAGDRVVVRSAGSAPAATLHTGVVPALVALGAHEAYPKPLTDDAVRAADVVVTMGCGDICPILPGKRYEDWAVGDPALAAPGEVAAIRDEIDRRVRALAADLLATDDAPRHHPETKDP